MKSLLLIFPLFLFHIITTIRLKTKVDINAGYIWNRDDAKTKCKEVCGKQGKTWNGSWDCIFIVSCVCGCDDAKK